MTVALCWATAAAVVAQQGGPECTSASTQAECFGNGGLCKWFNSSCGQDCARFSIAACAHVSYCRVDAGQCHFHCGVAATEAACADPQMFFNENCAWYGGACVPMPHCDTQAGAASCAAVPVCEWQPGFGGGKCTRKCSIITFPALCANNAAYYDFACHWTGANCVRACSSFQAYDCPVTATGAADAQCQLLQSGTLCTARCDRFAASALVCTAVGCAYNATSGTCDQPCTSYDQAECPQDRCQTVAGAACAPLCDALVTATDCTDQQACTWLGNRCAVKCSTTTNCDASHCAMYDEDQVCATRCELMTVESVCQTSAWCSWSSVLQQCVHCDSLTDSLSCEVGRIDSCRYSNSWNRCLPRCAANPTAQLCGRVDGQLGAPSCNWIDGACAETCSSHSWEECQGYSTCEIRGGQYCATLCTAIVTPGASRDTQLQQCSQASDCAFIDGACVASCFNVDGTAANCPSRCILVTPTATSWECYEPCSAASCDPSTPQLNLGHCAAFGNGLCALNCTLRSAANCDQLNDGLCVQASPTTCATKCSAAPSLAQCGRGAFADCELSPGNAPQCNLACRMLTRAGCVVHGRCQWSGPLSICIPTCALRDGQRCSDGAGAGVCSAINGVCQRECGTIGDSSDCDFFSHCRWLSGAGTCVRNCDAITTADVCTQAASSCLWVGAKCLHVCSGASGSICAAFEHCQQSYGVCTFNCTTAATSCEAQATSLCRRDSRNSACVLRCAGYPTATSCNAANCAWQAGTCQQPPDCPSQTTSGGCDPVFCDWTHSSGVCSTRCDALTSRGACTDNSTSASSVCEWAGVGCSARCSQFPFAAVCAASGCQWAPLRRTCGPACPSRELSSCDVDGACDLVNGTCVVACSIAGCSAPDSPAYCVANASGSCERSCGSRAATLPACDYGYGCRIATDGAKPPVCVQLCTSIGTETSCNKLSGRCAWVAAASVCLPQCQASIWQGSANSPCPLYPDECEVVLNARYSLAQSYATCTAKCSIAKTAGVCSSTATEAAINYVEANGNGYTNNLPHCAWRFGSCKNVCAFFPNASRCATDTDCEWTSGNGCQSVCIMLTDKTECVSANFGTGCTWTDLKTCIRSCSSYSLTDCPSIGCLATSAACVPQCTVLASRTACETGYAGLTASAQPACFWSDSAAVCAQNCALMPAYACPSPCVATSNACAQPCALAATAAVCATQPFATSCSMATQSGTTSCLQRCALYSSAACPSWCQRSAGGQCMSRCEDRSAQHCLLDNVCQWTGLRCLPTCGGLTQPQCASRSSDCFYGGQTFGCLPRCGLATSESACTNWLGVQTCAWSAVLSTCHPRCTAFSANSCPEDFCYAQPSNFGPRFCVQRCDSFDGLDDGANATVAAACVAASPQYHCMWHGDRCQVNCSAVGNYYNTDNCRASRTCTPSATPIGESWRSQCIRNCPSFTNASACQLYSECAWAGGSLGCINTCTLANCYGGLCVYTQPLNLAPTCQINCQALPSCDVPMFSNECALYQGLCLAACTTYSTQSCPATPRCGVLSGVLQACVPFSCSIVPQLVASQSVCMSHSQCMQWGSALDCRTSCTVITDPALCRARRECNVVGVNSGCNVNCTAFNGNPVACRAVEAPMLYATTAVCEVHGNTCRAACAQFTSSADCDTSGYCTFNAAMGCIRMVTTLPPATRAPPHASSPSSAPTRAAPTMAAAGNGDQAHNTDIIIGVAAAAVVAAGLVALAVHRRRRHIRGPSPREIHDGLLNTVVGIPVADAASV